MAMNLAEERQEWPDQSDNPKHATLTLLKEVEPALKEVDGELLDETFATIWQHFEESHHLANVDGGAHKPVEQLLAAILKHLQPEIVAIRADAMVTLTSAMDKRYKTGKTLDDLLPEAFAVVREAGLRKIKMRHYDVQLIGGTVLHQGKIAEMRTGEGKTLVATLPVYLNALTGKGVHVVTVNDYLARRDAEWMARIYKFLGLSVGIIINAVETQTPERRPDHDADITYGTITVLGFDTPRDNMVVSMDHMLSR